MSSLAFLRTMPEKAVDFRRQRHRRGLGRPLRWPLAAVSHAWSLARGLTQTDTLTSFGTNQGCVLGTLLTRAAFAVHLLEFATFVSSSLRKKQEKRLQTEREERRGGNFFFPPALFLHCHCVDRQRHVLPRHLACVVPSL